MHSNFRIPILLFILSFFYQKGHAQYVPETDTLEDGTVIVLPPPKPVKHTIYIELLGNGGVYSVNYEYFLLKKTNVKWGLRTGYCFLTQQYDISQNFILESNLLFGPRNAFLEIGSGIDYYTNYMSTNGTFFSQQYYDSEFIYFLRTGFRFQQLNREGFMFRLALTPYFNKSISYDQNNLPYRDDKYSMHFHFGISVGFGF